MFSRPAIQHVYGPFDGDFDPFEDDEDLAVLITFGAGRGLSRAGRATAPSSGRATRPPASAGSRR